jgi:hypothetical protein
VHTLEPTGLAAIRHRIRRVVHLKYALPFLGISLIAQVVILLVVATFIAWRFWWNCSPDRRGVALLIVVLWIGGFAKILAQ